MLDQDYISVNEPNQNCSYEAAVAMEKFKASVGLPSLGIYIDVDSRGPVSDRFLKASEVAIDPNVPATFVSMVSQPKEEGQDGQFENLGADLHQASTSSTSFEFISRLYANRYPGITDSEVWSKITSSIPSVNAAVNGRLNALVISAGLGFKFAK